MPLISDNINILSLMERLDVKMRQSEMNIGRSCARNENRGCARNDHISLVKFNHQWICGFELFEWKLYYMGYYNNMWLLVVSQFPHRTLTKHDGCKNLCRKWVAPERYTFHLLTRTTGISNEVRPLCYNLGMVMLFLSQNDARRMLFYISI